MQSRQFAHSGGSHATAFAISCKVVSWLKARVESRSFFDLPMGKVIRTQRKGKTAIFKSRKSA